MRSTLFLLFISYGIAILAQNPQYQSVEIIDNSTLGGKYSPTDALLKVGDGTINLLLDGNEIYTNQHLFFGSSYAHDFIFRNVDGAGQGNLMRIKGDGTVGIGTDEPKKTLHINGDVGVGMQGSGPWPGLSINYTDGGSGTTTFKHLRWGSHTYFVRNSSEGEKNVIYFGGVGGTSGHKLDVYDGDNEVKVRLSSHSDSFILRKLGIGTTSPDAKLTVKGEIHAEEVKVDLSVPGPDYVFEADYNLRTLEETEAFIKSNKHLPEVPSAKEMEANGVQLSKMNMLLLKKIEELTLHLIEVNKENTNLRQELKANSQRQKELMASLKSLTDQLNELKTSSSE